MAKYRKVDSRIWNDAKFRELSDSGKLVLFFVLTHPNMTALGAMRHTIPGMAAELGWSTEAFREAFGEACQKGIVKHDEKASFVWLPNFIKYNPPESPNVVKAWTTAVDLLPECALLEQLIQHVKEFLKGFAEGFQKAFGKSLAKSMPNQEQEQEQEEDILPRETSAASPGQPPTEEISLPCEDGSEFVFPEKWLATMRKAYPQVDIPTQALKARAWLESSPARKKTRRGMKKFFNTWLATAQKDAQKAAGTAPPPTRGRKATAADAGPAPWARLPDDVATTANPQP